MITQRIAAVSGLALLTACGSSGGGDEIAPLSSVGFANEGAFDGVEEVTFTFPNALRTFRDADGNTSFKRQEVAVEFNLSGGAQSVEVDGRTFALQQDPGDANTFIFDDGTDYVELDLFDEGRGTSAFELFSVLDGDLNESYVVVGLDTAPEDIERLSGDATFVGTLDVSLRRDNFVDAFGSGEIELTADFDRNTIGGTATLVDDTASNADFRFDTISLTLEYTKIDGNGFEGDVSVTSGDIEGTLIDSGYEGRFFRTDASGVGGNLFGRIDIDGDPDDTFVNGYFLGSQTQ